VSGNYSALCPSPVREQRVHRTYGLIAASCRSTKSDLKKHGPVAPCRPVSGRPNPRTAYPPQTKSRPALLPTTSGSTQPRQCRWHQDFDHRCRRKPGAAMVGRCCHIAGRWLQVPCHPAIHTHDVCGLAQAIYRPPNPQHGLTSVTAKSQCAMLETRSKWSLWFGGGHDKSPRAAQRSACWCETKPCG
jgi:hypothetical protein